MLRRAAESLEHLLYSRDDQDSNCPSRFLTNGENPCDVANTILSCGQNVTSFLTLQPAKPSSDCTCNTVVYNLASACAYCYNNQTGTVAHLPSYWNWTTNCPKPLQEYTKYNGSNTISGVPKWAFNNITSDGLFEAEAVLDDNDSWSAVQILIPVIVGLVLLIVFAGLWLWRIRRRKRMRDIPFPTGIAMSSWWCCARPRRVRRRRNVKGEWSVDADDEPETLALQNAPPSRKSASPASSNRPRRRIKRLPRRVGTLVQHVQELLGRPVAVLERKGSARGESRYDIDADDEELRAAMAIAMSMDKPLPQSPEPSAPRSNHTGGISMGVLGLLSRLGLSTAASGSSGGISGGSYAGVNMEDDDNDSVEVNIQVEDGGGDRKQGGRHENAEEGTSRLGPANSATSDGAESGEDTLDERRPIEAAMSVADQSPATSYNPAPLPWAVTVNTSVPMLEGLGTGESGFLVPMDSPASGLARGDNGSVVLISGNGRDFSLGPSSEGAGNTSASACDSGSRSVRTNTTNAQSMAVYPPTPSDEARRFSTLGSPPAQDSVPAAMLLPPAFGGPPSAWVRGHNDRLVPRRARPRTISGNSSLNVFHNTSDEESTGLRPVPALPSIGTSQSRSATTSSSLRVEPQTPQTATESSGSHSRMHDSGSSVVGGLITLSQSPIASPRDLGSPSVGAATHFSDVGENFIFASPLPSTITALFDSLPNDDGPQSRRRPPSQPLFLNEDSLASPPLPSGTSNAYSAPFSGRPSLPPISETPVSPLLDALPTASTSPFTNASYPPAPPNSYLLMHSVYPTSTHETIPHGTPTGTSTLKSRSSRTGTSAFTNGSSLSLAPPNTAAAPSPEIETSPSPRSRSAQSDDLLEPEWRTDIATYGPPSTKSNQASSFSIQASPPIQKPYNNESKTSLPRSPPLAKHPSHSPSSSVSSLQSLQLPERPSGPRSHTHPSSVSSKATLGRAALASQTAISRPPDSPAPSMHGRSISISYLSPSVYPPALYNSPPTTIRNPYTPSQLSVAGSSTSLYSPQAPTSALTYSPALSSISLSSRPLPVPGQPSNPGLPPGASPARIPGEGLGARPLPPGPAISRVPSGSHVGQVGYGQFGQRYSTVAEEP